MELCCQQLILKRDVISENLTDGGRQRKSARVITCLNLSSWDNGENWSSYQLWACGEVNRLCQNNNAAALQNLSANDMVWSVMETQQRPKCEGRGSLTEERVDFLREYLLGFFLGLP